MRNLQTFYNQNKFVPFLNNQKTSLPSCIRNWFEKYFIEFTPEIWKKIFCLNRKLTLNTKVFEFQFKIIHRIYASDSYVSNFDDTVSKLCYRCHVDNNIPHFFVDCIRARHFWHIFNNWISTIEGSIITFTTSEIIFGKFGISNKSQYMNLCILYAKYFLHLKKETNFIQFGLFESFISLLKNRLLSIEKILCFLIINIGKKMKCILLNDPTDTR